MAKHRSFVDFNDEDESEVIRMANNFLHVMCITDGDDPAIPASALGYALAILMSQTADPEQTFSVTLNARDKQWRELIIIDKSIPIITHH